MRSSGSRADPTTSSTPCRMRTGFLHHLTHCIYGDRLRSRKFLNFDNPCSSGDDLQAALARSKAIVIAPDPTVDNIL